MSPREKSRAERRREARQQERGAAAPASPGRAGPRWGIVVVALLVGAGALIAALATSQRSGEDHEVQAHQAGGSSGGSGTTGDPPTKGSQKPKPPTTPKIYGYKVVKTYPHNPRHYCQGLVFDGGLLYEGTGHYGESILGRFDLDTGEPVNLIDLEPLYFGEGVAIWKNKIIQLTWKSGVAFVYDKKTFKKTGSFKYPGEGWGLTHDGKHLILSDGTPVLRFLDPEKYTEVRRLTVTDRGRRLRYLNELEFIDGEIYANIWKADQIARISPKDGRVVGWIDLTGLLPAAERRRHGSEVLNGIAYDAAEKRLLVTGKYWPTLFHIELVERKR